MPSHAARYASVAEPELRRDEHVTVVEARLGDRVADARLVTVDGRRVDRAITGLEGRRDRCLRAVVRHLEDTEAELRHRRAVVERDGGDGCHECFSFL
jgi:hypothetical protein